MSRLLQDVWHGLLSGSQTSLPSLLIYGIVVLAVALEGPLSILAASGAASTGLLNPVGVFVAATLGNLLGDAGWYALGRHTSLGWLLRKQRWVPVTGISLEPLTRLMHARAVELLVVAKATNGLVVPVLIASGLARVPMRTWLPVILGANLLISAVFVSAGYWGIGSALQIRQGLQNLMIAGTVILLLAILLVSRKWLRDRTLHMHYHEAEND